MKQSKSILHRKTGRPLSFDRHAALQAAKLLFWRHGYEATSLNELTAAMGVTPPSIYTAFGDKKQLFLEAVNDYISGPVNSQTIIDQAPTAREAALGLLQASAIGFTGEHTPPGCLLASSVISCSANAVDVQETLAGMRREIELGLKNKIRKDIEAGLLTVDCDADAMAGHIMATIQGLSTLARDGAPRTKLERVAAITMQAWPA
jgi:AcrR family transcriptional regulator